MCLPRGFLDLFIDLVDSWGWLGYLAYIGVYAALEVLAVPAIPLTMTAGVCLGLPQQVPMLCCVAGAHLGQAGVCKDHCAASAGYYVAGGLVFFPAGLSGVTSWNQFSVGHAGAIFGVVPGVAVVSVGATLACMTSFSLAR